MALSAAKFNDSHAHYMLWLPTCSHKIAAAAFIIVNFFEGPISPPPDIPWAMANKQHAYVCDNCKKSIAYLWALHLKWTVCTLCTL